MRIATLWWKWQLKVQHVVDVLLLTCMKKKTRKEEEMMGKRKMVL